MFTLFVNLLALALLLARSVLGCAMHDWPMSADEPTSPAVVARCHCCPQPTPPAESDPRPEPADTGHSCEVDEPLPLKPAADTADHATPETALLGTSPSNVVLPTRAAIAKGVSIPSARPPLPVRLHLWLGVLLT